MSDEQHITRCKRCWGDVMPCGFIAVCPKYNDCFDNLLAACEDCVELLEHIHTSLGAHHCTTGCPDIGKRVDRAHAAIAKSKAKA